MKVGLYFGSFNPIHMGHLIIANHVVEHTNLAAIWFVVSPQNPLKETASLLNEYNRLHLVELAIQDNPKFQASNIEFMIPKPSYTIDTMTYLSEKFPNYEFTLIMGSDSFQNLPKWKNYEQLLEQYEIIVYLRPGHPIDHDLEANIKIMKAPMLDISATFIRQQIKNKKSIKYLLPEVVKDYITENRYYE